MAQAQNRKIIPVEEKLRSSAEVSVVESRENGSVRIVMEVTIPERSLNLVDGLVERGNLPTLTETFERKGLVPLLELGRKVDEFFGRVDKNGEREDARKTRSKRVKSGAPHDPSDSSSRSQSAVN